MYKFPIGVIVHSFRLPTYDAIKEAAAIGAQGIQLLCTRGENTPENLIGEKRKDLLKYVKDNSLVFSAICGDFGQGFGHKEKNPELIEKSKRILDLAKELETDIVTTHIGVVPSDENHDRYKVMQEACFELSRYADSIGSHFAIETGPETSATLQKFLDKLDSKGVAVNLDPANLVMVTGDAPVVAVHNLKDYIVHTHAKDGVKLFDADPEYVYHVVHPIPEEIRNKRFYLEVPLGDGSVPYIHYLKALEEVGYRGFLTIEREVGDNPAKDIKKAIDYLKVIMEEN
ncbi:MAG: sugar phosphate isomerase/epimerase [Clostridia bacterium]|nr:sugar phosphate isomerase/epimerase [Clostridia bacterium]